MSRDRDQALRDILKGATVVYVGLLLEVLIAFLAQVLAAKFLSLEGFGGITTGTALLDIGAIVATLGFGEGLTRYLPRREAAEKQSLARTALLVTGVVATILGGAISLNAHTVAAVLFNDPAVTASIRIFGATIPFAAVLTVAIGGFRGQKISRYRVYVENLLRPTVRFVLVVCAVLLGLGQAGFALAYAIPYAVGAAVAVVLFARSMSGLFSSWSLDIRGSTDAIRYSLPFTATGAATFVVRSIDIFLILSLRGSAAVAVYGVAYAAARLVTMFSTAVNYLATPVSSELEVTDGTAGLISINDVLLRWLVVASIPTLVPFVLFPTEFISIVYRPRYATGAAVMTLLAVGFGVHNVLSTLGNVHRALGNASELAANSVVAAVVNLGLNLVLIPRLGIFGAGIATVVSYLLMDLLMVVELLLNQGELGVGATALNPLLVGAPLFGVAALLAPTAPGTLVGIILFSAGFGLVYLVAVVVVLGFTPEEAMLVHSAEERLGFEGSPAGWLVDRFS